MFFLETVFKKCNTINSPKPYSNYTMTIICSAEARFSLMCNHLKLSTWLKMIIQTLILRGERETLPVNGGDPVLRCPLPTDTDDGLNLLSGFDGYSCPKNSNFVKHNSIISLRINWISIVIVFTEVSK